MARGDAFSGSVAKQPGALAAPPGTAWAARAAALASLILVGRWVDAYLGGVAAGAEVSDGGAVSTDRCVRGWTV